MASSVRASTVALDSTDSANPPPAAADFTLSPVADDPVEASTLSAGLVAPFGPTAKALAEVEVIVCAAAKLLAPSTAKVPVAAGRVMVALPAIAFGVNVAVYPPDEAKPSVPVPELGIPSTGVEVAVTAPEAPVAFPSRTPPTWLTSLAKVIDPASIVFVTVPESLDPISVPAVLGSTFVPDAVAGAFRTVDPLDDPARARSPVLCVWTPDHVLVPFSSGIFAPLVPVAMFDAARAVPDQLPLLIVTEDPRAPDVTPVAGTDDADDAVPVSVAVMVPAEKFPLASRATIVLAVLVLVASVVREIAAAPVYAADAVKCAPKDSAARLLPREIPEIVLWARAAFEMLFAGKPTVPVAVSEVKAPLLCVVTPIAVPSIFPPVIATAPLARVPPTVKEPVSAPPVKGRSVP